jgi:hypothetical protein
MRIREPASLYRTKRDDEPGNLGKGCPVTTEISAPLSPYNTAPMNRFGHYELRFDQMPQPITEDLRLSPPLAVGERGPIGNFAWFVLIPLVHD